MKQRPTKYYMILDGQQRIQSLYWHWEGDDWGLSYTIMIGQAIMTKVKG